MTGPGNYVKEIFYHPKTGIQMVVSEWTSGNPFRGIITLHVPYEGPKGYRVKVRSWVSVYYILSLQQTKLGRFCCSLILTLAGRRLKPKYPKHN